MKKLILICFMLLVVSNISAIKINEIEMNPEDGTSGKEWIELYNDENEDVDISNWELYDGLSSSRKISAIPEGTIIEERGYYVVELSSAFLNNKGDFVILYDNEGNEIDKTETLKDSDWSIETWQLCDSWEFLGATKGEKNKCEEEPENETDEDVEETENLLDENEEDPVEDATGGLGGEVTLTPEVISLTPKDIKSEDNIESLDKTDYAKYGFIGFCILIGVLLILKNKRKQKNEIV